MGGPEIAFSPEISAESEQYFRRRRTTIGHLAGLLPDVNVTAGASTDTLPETFADAATVDVVEHHRIPQGFVREVSVRLPDHRAEEFSFCEHLCRARYMAAHGRP